MKQLTQKLKTGQMRIIDVPIPDIKKGYIIDRSHYSLVSSGTEASTVRAARKGYIGKAIERPQQVQQVINTLKNQGVAQTYRTVMKKLDAFSPLGYSCAGEIIDLSSKTKGFKIGDMVGCGGITASHSEVVSVPVNLCVKLKSDADLKQAAYNTLGAIALQGVRQADVRIGESCAIIGLGLLGQLSALLLNAAGIRVIGIDIDPSMVKLSRKSGVELALHRDEAGVENKIMDFTEGWGSDAVIITASSNSLDPINFAGVISKKKGTIVIVGDVPTGFDREPHLYKKELQVKMSCSYGPGRYDPTYEEKGIDYPPAYVRWTENRNMLAFQEFIYSKKIDVSHLTTHTFKLNDAPRAYEMILSKSEPFIGILIEYDSTKKIDIENRKVELKISGMSYKPSDINIGFIGAGSYAQSHLLPNIPKNNEVSLKGVMNTTGTSSRSVAERFGFEFCTTNEKDIIENDNINTVFIATQHDSHAKYVIKVLEAGKHVFVEKPLCLNFEELKEIKECYEQSVKSKQLLMVGYNRRFSPLTQMLKRKFGSGPVAVIYRINAGFVPIDSWLHDIEVGGGRIIGEICHFIDLLTYISGSLPKSDYAVAMKNSNNFDDTLSVSLSYQNGSIATILYCANGNKLLPKELIEVYANGCTAILGDFKFLKIYANNKKRVKKLLNQNKGQKNEVKKFLQTVLNGDGALIPFNEIYNTSLVTFKIIESIRCGHCLKL